MPAVFEFTHTVEPQEIDPQGHANNVEFARWMQSAALAHSTAQGWSPERYLETGVGWVARRHVIEYRHPAFTGDRLVVRTWVAGLRRVSSLRKYKIVRLEPDGNETLLAVAETNWAFIDLKKQTPRRILPEVAKAFDIVEAEVPP